MSILRLSNQAITLTFGSVREKCSRWLDWEIKSLTETEEQVRTTFLNDLESTHLRRSAHIREIPRRSEPPERRDLSSHNPSHTELCQFTQ
mgnify:FL=1